jgi:hypothetical protein
MGKSKHGKIGGKWKPLMITCWTAINACHGHDFVLPQFANGGTATRISDMGDIPVTPIDAYDSDVISHAKHSHLITRKRHVEGEKIKLEMLVAEDNTTRDCKTKDCKTRCHSCR